MVDACVSMKSVLALGVLAVFVESLRQVLLSHYFPAFSVRKILLIKKSI